MPELIIVGSSFLFLFKLYFIIISIRDQSTTCLHEFCLECLESVLRAQYYQKVLLSYLLAIHMLGIVSLCSLFHFPGIHAKE